MSIRRSYRFQHPDRNALVVDVSIFGENFDKSPTQHKTPYPLVTLLDAEGDIVETFHADEFAELIGDVVRVAEKLQKVCRKHQQDAEAGE